MSFNKKGSIMAKIFGMIPVATLACGIATACAEPLPAPTHDDQLAAAGAPAQNIVLAGGCFWGVQAVFQHVKGVTKAVSGYAGGDAATAHYAMVSTGMTGHAESVQVTYDPATITLGQILRVYFSVAHDPTELDRQGPDHGTQYRSEIFYETPDQQKIAAAYIAQLQQAKIFNAPIVTKLKPLRGFYAAEDYHQNYARLHPDNPYIAINDLPKVAALAKLYPDLYVTP
ncbi:MAG: peptide-methionine (S)-S-oxide reductase MsrA [Alphaproteobacteria bacterium]|nr:peptide-methionine (S)-S-oxide reductase MsrA [Alphaproteobacteria bacterium]